MKKSFFFLYVLLAAMILPVSTLAIGVTPSRLTADFVPSGSFESSVCFHVDGLTTLKIVKEGVLKDRIEIIGLGSDGYLDTLKDGSCIKYKVTLPEKFDTPGIQASGISAVEVPPTNTGATIYAVTKIIHQIHIVVPYPGQYLEGGITTQNKPSGESVPVHIVAVNKGSETIKSAVATIKIYDNKNTTIGTVTTNEVKDIVPGSQAAFIAEWNSSIYKSGNYKAVANLKYDTSNINFTSDFKLGGLDISVSDYTQEIVIGGIKQFYILLDSIWSEEIEAKAVVKIYNQTEDQPLQTFETITRKVAPWSKDQIQGYVNTDSLGLGEFDVKITLEFEGNSKDFFGKVKIVEPPKQEEEAPQANKVELFTTKNLMIGIGMILVIIAVLVVKQFWPKNKSPDSQLPQQPKQ